ncbi:hypothetical protein GXM_08568 [Nostoc sphaeroides CCNUC1]|uniref:Uncharacterized protein n=1 Tax=Nostoc sphaeroides CCNUC1 TaxID=2653204 RepID=A0A5P8WEI9_9NOSO|nr:hypothetical protein GXM_08568 [Nostoc sphaeroides CCNUC1]
MLLQMIKVFDAYLNKYFIISIPTTRIRDFSNLARIQRRSP